MLRVDASVLTPEAPASAPEYMPPAEGGEAQAQRIPDWSTKKVLGLSSVYWVYAEYSALFVHGLFRSHDVMSQSPSDCSYVKIKYILIFIA